MAAPRATLAELPRVDARGHQVGIRDGLWLTALYVLSSQVTRLAGGFAALGAMGNINGGLVLLQALGRSFLPPVVLLFVVEGVLGAPRSYRRGLFLAPLVVFAALGRLSAALGAPWPGPSFGPDLLGTVWAAGLAFACRWQIDPEPDEGEPEASAPAAPVRVASTPARVVVAISALGLVAVSAGRELADVRREWSTMGPLAPGHAVPEFSASVLGGGRFETSDLSNRGEVTVLAFWATWCGACAQQMPGLVDLDRRFDDRGLALYGVNIDREGDQDARAARYVEAKGLTFPILLDTGRIGDVFRVSLIPHIVVFDRSGELRYVHQGKVRAATLEREIETLLAE